MTRRSVLLVVGALVPVLATMAGVATRSDALPAPAVAVSLALLLAVGVALARQARGR